MSQQIAIVGLGRVGSIFLDGLLHHSSAGLSIVAVSEKGDTSGKALAMSHGIPVMDIDGIVAQGEKIDILFDLTGAPAVRRDLREKMMATNNRHTIIATEAIARLVWSLIADEALPDVHGKPAY